MKGDFSRIRFNPKKQYTAVLEQQGRVALDADANEQCAINDYLRETETLDVVGRWGGPAGDEGFAITVKGHSIEIGKGRYYVNGILCENLQPLAYLRQPFLIHPHPTDAELLRSLSRGEIKVIQVYLEVWQRLVTPLDDPCLREPALGQADTTDRLQTVWRVVAVVPASSTGSTAPAAPEDLTIQRPVTGRFPALKSTLESRLSTFTSSAASATGEKPSTPSQIFRDCCAEMRLPRKSLAHPGKLSAFTGGGGSECSCQPTPPAGYLGLENQLYRVEIHEGGNETQATFKWSRENASVVVGITGVSGSQVYVDSLGPDANLGFSPGQWVEISDDSNLFGLDPNQPGDLYQVQGVTPETLSLTMTATVAAVDPTRNARLRRWDQFGSAAGSNGIGLAVTSPYVLENGISIQFSAGQYEPGDYWLIPARTATGEIEWPPCDSDGSAFQRGQRIVVYRAPLACIQWDGKAEKAVPHDCRDKFYPLTELTPPETSPTLQVTKVSWANDDVMTLDQLAANGLTVTLNQAAPDPRYVTPANFSVILEVAVPVGPARQELASARMESAVKLQDFLTSIGVSQGISFGKFEGQFVTLVRYELVLDGQTSANGSTLTWQIPWEPNNPAETITLELLDVFLLVGAVRNVFGRVRVKLAGNALFAGALNQVFLDGACLGAPAVRADGTTPRIDLQFPSGAGVAASDFESWFYLAPTQFVAGISIDHPNLLINPDGTVLDAGSPSAGAVSPQGIVALQYPAILDTVVGLSVSGSTSSAGIFFFPPSVTVPRGQKSKTFSINVYGNPGPVTDQWQLIASLPNAVGVSLPQQTPFTITGSQGVAGVTFNFSGLGVLIGPNKNIVVVDAANQAGGAVTPQGFIMMSSPSPSPTVVTLSVIGGTPGVVTVPQTVTIPANQRQATFPITVASVPQATMTVSIAATVTPAGGSPSTRRATLTVHNLT